MSLALPEVFLPKRHCGSGMDDIGSSLRPQILAENIEMLRSNGIVPGKLPNGHVPIDIDVAPFDNSKTQKTGRIQDL